MYGFECDIKLKQGACPDKRCIYPVVCPALKPSHQQQIELLRRIRRIPGVKKVFVGSGLRYDLILADHKHGRTYLKELAAHHVSGQLKVAPEHSRKHVLDKMGKPGKDALLEFKRRFDEQSQAAGKRQYLTYYLDRSPSGLQHGGHAGVEKFRQPRAANLSRSRFRSSPRCHPPIQR